MSEEIWEGSSRTLYLIAAILGILLVSKKFAELKPMALYWAECHAWLTAGIMSGLALTVGSLAYAGIQILLEGRKMRQYIESVTAEAPGSVYAGRSGDGARIFIPIDARKMHTQVIGTTNAGKSESVIIPWAVGDMQDQRGFVIVDGKADKSFLQKIYAYAVKFKRTEDFKVFSLQDPSRSHTFNPLLGGTPEEVAERVFNSFEFDNPYYESIQFEVFSQVLRIFDKAALKPTFLRLYQAIKRPSTLFEMAVDSEDKVLIHWASNFKALTATDREGRTSGLLASLSHFAFGSYAKLFNTDDPDIDLDRALKKGELVYFQLPVLKAAFLGKATGKLVLQCLQSAAANRHGEDFDGGSQSQREHPFFSIYLDDFTEYLYPGFVSLLNKSRSANVGVVFAHQALGDIKALGDDVATSILTNSNLKVIMRGNDPESAEYFAKVIGTKTGEQVTERAESGLFGSARTGQGSIREVEEFIVHPNVIKRKLGVGEALVILPHRAGTKTVKIKFAMLPSLSQQKLPRPPEKTVLGLDAVQDHQPTRKNSGDGNQTNLVFVEDLINQQEVS